MLTWCYSAYARGGTIKHCPYCEGSASFATIEGEPRIYGHPCPKLAGTFIYWHQLSPMVFGTLGLAQQTYAKQAAAPVPEWMAEVFDLVSGEIAAWPDWLREEHGVR